MIASASLARSLRSAVGEPARMRRASKGSWARKSARRRFSGEGFHVAERAGRLSIPKTRQGQELHVFGSLSLAEGAVESSL